MLGYNVLSGGWIQTMCIFVCAYNDTLSSLVPCLLLFETCSDGEGQMPHPPHPRLSLTAERSQVHYFDVVVN